MDIQKLREEFEKLPVVAGILSNHVFWHDECEQYQASDDDTMDNADWLNGAWYMYKQQNKIDEIKAMAESWINQDYTHNSDSTDIKIQQMKDCGRDIIRKINGE